MTQQPSPSIPFLPGYSSDREETTAAIPPAVATVVYMGMAFRDEIELLRQIRHPNVVQFLGALTQSSPMMIVVECFAKGE
ncbi:hypothetical protein E3N88_22715 [Mikania micrantha]|uniref:Serine-threonine/tyrosine-protein kinase catalytic domain-containing protein n=1 Tax=Mikania micrantha TaxID=192012 RepID=A0A5N6NBG0_9ASTR|nr:hypothetical protein E3N88_22715 [Mikania micrantha]